MKYRQIIVTLFAISLLLTAYSLSYAQGESAAALYNRGNSRYASGDYAGAIENYEKALSGGFRNAHIEYNLGNAYLKHNPPNLAKAILHYERAKKLDPRDPDLRYNIAFATARIKGKLPLPERSFIARAWDWLIGRIAMHEAAASLSAFYFLFAIALTAYFLARSKRWRTISLGAAGAALLFALLSAPVAWGAFRQYNVPRAVILQDDLPVRSGPGDANPELFKLYEGVVVERSDCRYSWCQVKLQSGLSGWIPQDKMGNI